MSSSRRSDEADEAQELLLQERLQILLKRLRWSYAALWTLNPHTRVLQWKRGHYSSQVDASEGGTAWAAISQPKLDWYAQQFYTTYKSCSFTPGSGFVGRASLEGRHMWLRGDSVCQNAGSLEQSQFLSHAKIKTVMCIPWLSSVLELGTTNFVGENFQLMDQIQQLLCHDLLSAPALHEDDFAPGFVAGREATDASQAAAAALQQQAHSTAQLNQSAFDINMSDQVWRSDMIFMHKQDNLPVDLAVPWRRAVGVGDNPIRQENLNASSTSHGNLMNLPQGADQYASRTNSFAGTTHATTSSSTSVSSLGDQYSNSSSATRLAANALSTPELLHQHIMQTLSPPIAAISGSTAPDRTSSTTRLTQPGEPHLEAYSIKHEMHATGARNQNNNLRRTTSCGDEYEIQKALSIFEALEMQDQWRQLQGLNPVAEAAGPSINMLTHDQSNVSFHSWHHGHDPGLDPTLSNQSEIMNTLRKQASKVPRAGQLQRRHTVAAMEVLKEVETYQQLEAAANSNLVNSSEQDHFLIQTESQPRPAQEQMNTPMLRGRARATSSGSGRGSGIGASHDEAALNHVMAERRRRVKQKENFATLRRLVPIISKYNFLTQHEKAYISSVQKFQAKKIQSLLTLFTKADKASTLVDAIVYLKDLQNTIVEMKANENDMVQRCEDLASKCMKLEEQNKKLVEVLSTDKPPGGSVHLNTLNLQSMKSI